MDCLFLFLFAGITTFPQRSTKPQSKQPGIPDQIRLSQNASIVLGMES